MQQEEAISNPKESVGWTTVAWVNLKWAAIGAVLVMLATDASRYIENFLLWTRTSYGLFLIAMAIVLAVIFSVRGHFDRGSPVAGLPGLLLVAGLLVTQLSFDACVSSDRYFQLREQRAHVLNLWNQCVFQGDEDACYARSDQESLHVVNRRFEAAIPCYD